VVLAQRADDRDAFRALDATGAPSGPWVCLNAASTANEHAGAIHSVGGDFLVLFRDVDDSEKLVRVTDATQGG
jgi:hypothetical protein